MLAQATTRGWNKSDGEGASFLLLLGVAMPLKYLLGLPLAVRVVGILHGLLFVLYAFLVAEALGARRFSVRTALLALLASVLPFGPFVFERKFGQPTQTEKG